MVQLTAAHRNILQHNATHSTFRSNPRGRKAVVVLTAAHRNILQHNATHRNTLNFQIHSAEQGGCGGTLCNTPQHTAQHCNTPQHTQHATTHRNTRNTPQHTATHRNTPQHTQLTGPILGARKPWWYLILVRDSPFVFMTVTRGESDARAMIGANA